MELTTKVQIRDMLDEKWDPVKCREALSYFQHENNLTDDEVKSALVALIQKGEIKVTIGSEAVN